MKIRDKSTFFRCQKLCSTTFRVRGREQKTGNNIEGGNKKSVGQREATIERKKEQKAVRKHETKFKLFYLLHLWLTRAIPIWGLK